MTPTLEFDNVIRDLSPGFGCSTSMSYQPIETARWSKVLMKMTML